MTDIATYEKAGRAACHAGNYSHSPEERDAIFEQEKAYWCDVAQAAIEAHNKEEGESNG